MLTIDLNAEYPRSEARAILWRTRFSVRASLLRRHRLYLLYSTLKHPEKTVNAKTQIVIEGPLRCGNTFAVAAFNLAQPHPIAVGHHRHAAAQVVAGVRRGLPVLVLTRQPKDAVVSLVIRHQLRMPIQRALRDYVAFYEDIIGYKDSFVVADFREVTTDFGSVIERVNRRFDTKFALFEHSDENVRRCFDMIDRDHRNWFGRIIEEKIERPSTARSDLQRRVAARFESETDGTLRHRADELYAAICDETVAMRSRVAP